MSQPALRHRSAESADTDYLVSQSRQPLFATTGISPGNQPQPGGRYWGTLRAAASRQSNRDSDRQELAELRRPKGGTYAADERLQIFMKTVVPKICFSIHNSVDSWRQCARSLR